MFLRRLLLLALLAPLAACSSASSDDAPNDESAIERGTSKETIYRVEQDGGAWLFRIAKNGNTLKGHFEFYTPPGGPPTPAGGSVDGTVDPDGTVHMTWQMPDWGKGDAPPAPFVGKKDGDDIVGNLVSPGQPPQPMHLKLLAPGTMQDGLPLLARSQLRSKNGNCEVEATRLEFFALADAKLERDLNAKFAAAEKRAATLCAANVAQVSGGAYAVLLRKDLITYSTSATIYGTADDDLRFDEGERVNISLADGKPITLFADVIQKTKKAELRAAIDKAVDDMPADMFFPVARNQPRPSPDPADALRAEIKTIMQNLSDDELAKNFILGERGVGFRAIGSTQPRIRSVLVKYDAVQPILVANSRAKSAWTP